MNKYVCEKATFWYILIFLWSSSNFSDQEVAYGRKSDELAQVSLVKIYGCDVDK